MILYICARCFLIHSIIRFEKRAINHIYELTRIERVYLHFRKLTCRENIVWHHPHPFEVSRFETLSMKYKTFYKTSTPYFNLKLWHITYVQITIKSTKSNLISWPKIFILKFLFFTCVSNKQPLVFIFISFYFSSFLKLFLPSYWKRFRYL